MLQCPTLVPLCTLAAFVCLSLCRGHDECNGILIALYLLPSAVFEDISSATVNILACLCLDCGNLYFRTTAKRRTALGGHYCNSVHTKTCVPLGWYSYGLPAIHMKEKEYRIIALRISKPS